MARPVCVVASGGSPFVSVSDGPPATPVADGPPITLVEAGAPPICLVNDDGSAWFENVADADYGWDFIANQAIWNSASIGALANTPNWTFTRASTAYYTNSAGVLTSVASGVLRTGDRGALIEGARTNLCLQSQTFDNASWTKSRASIVANATTAPDGTLTADKLVEDSATGTHRAFQPVDKAASAITYTGSVYAKAAERNFISVKLTDNTETDGVAVGANLTTGELTAISSLGGGFTSASATATAQGDGWWRITLTATSDTDTRVTLFTQVSSVLSATASYTGDGVSGIYVWGAQLEAAAFPSSYIPTTTASATRAADVLTVPVSGLDYPLSLFAEFERAVDTGTFESLLYVRKSTTDLGALYIGSSDVGTVSATSSSASQGSPSVAGAIAVGTTKKLAGRIATNDMRPAMNGTLGGQDTSVTLPALAPDTIDFGHFSGGTQLNNYLRRAALWTRALTDAELQSVST